MDFPSQLLKLLVTKPRITVLTGAGVSAESNVPTFRDAQTGLWANFRPEELATPGAFRKNPKLVWEWYAWRRELVTKADPNPAHFALAEMQKHWPQFTLITQNVDGLHQRAGSTDVIELHGNISRTKCFEEDVVVESWPATDQVPPPCPRCGRHLRPDVVWFEEVLPETALKTAIERSGACDVFFSIGTSALVYPAAALPGHAQKHGAVFVEINPDPTPLSDQADFVLTGPAGRVLPELLAQISV